MFISKTKRAFFYISALSSLLFATSCQSLWGGFSEPDTRPCETNSQCQSNQYCNPKDSICEDFKLDAVSKTEGSWFGGTEIKFTGSGFSSDTTVLVGPNRLGNFQLDPSNHSITGLTPPMGAVSACRTPVEISISKPNAPTIKQPGGFTYIFDKYYFEAIKPITTTNKPIAQIFIDDFNGDKNRDILFSTTASGTMFQLSSVSSAFVGQGVTEDILSGATPKYISGTMRSDRGSVPGIIVYENQVFTFYKYTSNQWSVASTLLSATAYPKLSMTADLDGDEIEELVVFSENGTGKNISIYKYSNAQGFYSVFNDKIDSIPVDTVVAKFGASKTSSVIAVYGIAQTVSSFGMENNVWTHTKTSLPSGSILKKVTSADFNGDGFGDLAFYSPSGKILVSLYQTDGSLNTKFYDINVASISPDQLLAADLNCDGLADIVMNYNPAYNPGQKIQILKNNGSGNFSIYTEKTRASEGIIAIAKANDDELPDIIVGFTNAASGASTLQWIQGGSR
ncbi:MAG TPA: IPT/TIG domain-containing protein [Pseudomonadota bacterium]|nr:IPT/TIG domain-containing protein [Pseudomonadota bacterium]